MYSHLTILRYTPHQKSGSNEIAKRKQLSESVGLNISSNWKLRSNKTKSLYRRSSRVSAQQPTSVLCYGTRTRFLNGSYWRKVLTTIRILCGHSANVHRRQCSSRTADEDRQSNAQLPASSSEYSCHPESTTTVATYSYAETSRTTFRPKLLTETCSWAIKPGCELSRFTARTPNTLFALIVADKSSHKITNGNAARWEYPTEYCRTRSATTTAFPELPPCIAAAA